MKEILDFFKCFVFLKNRHSNEKTIVTAVGITEYRILFFFFLLHSQETHEKMIFVWRSGINAGGCSPAETNAQGFQPFQAPQG